MNTRPRHLKLIPANRLADDLDAIPELPGVYLFFLNGGTRLLEETAYFEMDSRHPMSVDGRTHLYTGAAHNLRLRMKQHLRRGRLSSSFRQTLLAIERVHGAVSKSAMQSSAIDGEEPLSAWLHENLTIGIRLSTRPFALERRIIGSYVSPLNITLRRAHPYSRALMRWRTATFPPWTHPEYRSMKRSNPSGAATVNGQANCAKT